jgi:hypothetical protein
VVKNNLSAISAQLRAFILLLTAYSLLPFGLAQQPQGQSAQPIHAAVMRADLMPGADAGAKIAACIGALPSTGGTCDARGLQGAQTIENDPFSSAKGPLTLLLGAATFTLNARVNPLISDTKVLAEGTTFICAAANDCIAVGNLTNPNAANKMVISGLTIEPGSGSVGYSAIRDNAQGTVMSDLRFLANGANKFSHLFELDDDQAATIEKLSVPAQAVLLCNAMTCGSAIWNPPGGGNSALLWLRNSNLALGCSGNGIDWQNGAPSNELSAEDTVIEAYNQFAVRSNSNVTVRNLHNEVGNCKNPWNTGNWKFGQMGYGIQQGYLHNVGAGFAGNNGPPMGGSLSQFSVEGKPGSVTYHYFVVANSGSEPTVPLPVGFASNGPSAFSPGISGVYVTWPAIAKATSYTLIRLGSSSAPPASGPWDNTTQAVFINQTPGSLGCRSNYCTYLDEQNTLQTFNGSYPANWEPILNWWPGDLVLSGGGANAGKYFGIAPLGTVISTNAFGVSAGNGGGTILEWGLRNSTANRFPATTGAELNLMGSVVNGPPFGWLLTNEQPYGNSKANGMKGVLNLGGWAQGATTTDRITLDDAHWFQTSRTLGNRPPASASDSAICKDGGYGYLCARAQKAVSFYINSLPDDKSWKMRLTSNGLTLATGVAGDGSGFKHKRFASPLGGTCPTAATVGAKCTSAPLDWPTPFTDNNYSVTCSLDTVTHQPHIVVVSKLAAGAGVTVTIAADTPAAANAGVECIAVHD